jgi:response regulator RpfG family c-di-GMP phosphodiesterase
LEVAATNPDRVVDAEALSQHSAASVELGAAFAVAQAVDTRLGRSGHSVRIGDYSTEIARFLQLEPFDIAAVGLAGRLHDVGMLTLGSTAFDSSSAGYEAAQAAHPERGERYVRSSCGPVVAEMIRSHHETWDGSGSTGWRARTYRSGRGSSPSPTSTTSW